MPSFSRVATELRDAVLEDAESERLILFRQVRQRLESLRRAGLDRITAPDLRTIVRTQTRDSGVAEEATGSRPESTVEGSSGPAPPTRVFPTPPARRPPTAATLFGEPELEVPTVPAAERPALLTELAAEVAACTRCPVLSKYRTQTVFGVGNPNARLMFVGEAPGADEDRTGIPFVGRAGMLLTDMITKGMGLLREDVYIANVVKSRPPENRNPEPDEIAHCLPFLERQIAIIRPEFLCLLGKVAASALLETALSLGRLRGKWHQYRGIPTIVTYHPSFLLRTPASKKDAWQDLQMLMQAMGLQPPARGKR